MAENYLTRQWDGGRILQDHENRINVLEKRGDPTSALDLLLNPPACRVRRTTNQSINDNTVTPIDFTSERWDTDSMHDNGVNPSRITINTAGLYVVGGAARVANAADYTQINARVLLNGATILVHSDSLVSASAGIPQLKAVSTEWLFAAGDYIELAVLQDNTANTARNVESTSAGWTEFWATRVGSGT